MFLVRLSPHAASSTRPCPFRSPLLFLVPCLTDALIVSHFPHGPTVYFTLHNVVLRHDIASHSSSTVSEQYPHLIFDGFESKLGKRVMDVLRFLFPVPKEDSKRVMTFANEGDFVTFRSVLPRPPFFPTRLFWFDCPPSVRLRVLPRKEAIANFDHPLCLIFIQSSRLRKDLAQVGRAGGGGTSVRHEAFVLSFVLSLQLSLSVEQPRGTLFLR